MPDVITVTSQALEPAVVDPLNPSYSAVTGPVDLTFLDFNFTAGPSGRLDTAPYSTDFTSVSPALSPNLGFPVEDGALQVEQPPPGTGVGVLWPFDAPNPQTPNRYLRAAGRITSLAESAYWPAVAMLVQWRWSATKSTSLIVVPGMVFSPGGWLVVPYVFVIKNDNGALEAPAASLAPDPLPDPQPGPETPPTAWSFLLEWLQEPDLDASLYVSVGTPNETTPYTMFSHRFYLSGHEAALLDGETGPLPEPDYVGLFVPVQLINEAFGVEVPAGEITLLGSGRFINGSFTNAASPAQSTSQADSPLEWLMTVPPATTTDLCDVKLQDGPLLRGIRDGFVKGEQVGC